MATGEPERVVVYAFGATATDSKAWRTGDWSWCGAGNSYSCWTPRGVFGRLRAALQRFGGTDLGQAGKAAAGSASAPCSGNRGGRGWHAVCWRSAGVFAQSLRVDTAFRRALSRITKRLKRILGKSGSA